MRSPFKVASGFLLLGGLAACSGGGATSSLPSSAQIGSNAPANIGAARAAQSSGIYTYTAPWGNFTKGQAGAVLNPQGVCGHIPVTLGSGFAWPAFLSTLSSGATVTVTGVPSYSDSWSQSNGCPTGGIVASAIVLGSVTPPPTPTPKPTSSPTPKPTPSPLPTPTPSPTPTGFVYTAPWGSFSGSTTAILNPQGPCGHIPVTRAAGFAWPAFLSTLPAGTVIKVWGTPSYADAWSKSNGCPTGGLVATSIALSSGSPTPTPTPTVKPTTGPTPTPTPVGSLPFGSLPPDYEVPSTWHPYSAGSTWNQQLGANPQLDPNDSTKMNWIFSSAFNSGQSVNQYQSGNPYTGGGLPVWFAKTSDPLVNVVCTAGYGPGGSNACPLPSKVYIPALAVAQNNVDQHIILVQPDGTEVDVWRWGTGNLAYVNNPPGQQLPPWHTGETVQVAWGGTASASTGTGWDNGAENGAATVSGADLLAGFTFASEIGSGHINHALAVLLPCNPAPNVYPALIGGGADYRCNGAATSGSAPIGMGSRFWLDTPDSTIATYPVPNGEKAILYALHDYGAFAVDDNGYAFEFWGLESPQAGVTYGNNFASPIYASNFNTYGPTAMGFSGQGVGNDDFDRYVKPHLHVLAPCVNAGYPGGQCAH